MAKVTEQELKDLGFKRKWFSDKSGYWFEKRVKHKIFGTVLLYTDQKERIYVSVHSDSLWYDIYKKLTHDNLNLFIRFAEGKEL